MSESEQKPTFEKHSYKPGAYYPITVPIGQGKTDYEKYIRTGELLALQTPNEKAASHEEILFQIYFLFLGPYILKVLLFVM